MPKYLRLYNKNGELLKTSKNIEGNTGVITIENLFPETLYHEGDFLVSWVINGNELSKAPVPEFRTLELMDNKTIVVYFSDITEEQLIALKGDSAYKIALDNGFRGTQQDWLESLKGEPGEQGEPGKNGVDITEGGSAYEIALSEGFQGTREEWLESLKGEPGEPGEPGRQGDPGEDGFGVDGASAYEIALENGFVGNIQDFLDSLVGEPGRDGLDGNDGLSAYQVALENGFTGTEQEWLETLKGGLTGTENWQKRKVTSDDGTVINVDKPNLNAPDTYFTNSGFYYVTTSTGFPEGVSANGYITFLIRNPNYSIMTFQPYNSERVFTKAKLNGNWGYWNEIGGRKEDRITSDYVVEIVMNTIENEINILRSDINEDSMYSEIDYLSYIDSITDTKYTVTTIPREDSKGNKITLSRGYANDNPNNGSLETAREFALRKNASFVTNASVFDTNTGALLGRQMDKGTIINNTPHRDNYTLTIDNDRTLNAIPSTTDLNEITTSIDALTAFFPIVLNGEKVDSSVYSSIPNTGQKNPRQIIAQKEDGTILVVSVQGRGINGQGMDYEDTYRICSELGVKFAYHLDGGGSMQTNVRGSLITNPIDDNGTKERKVKDFLYVTVSDYIQKNKSSQKEFSSHSKNISDIQVKMNKLSEDFSNIGTIPDIGDFKKTTTFVSDVNTIKQSGMYWVTKDTLNTPGDYSYGLFHWQVNPTSALQMIVPFHINLGETLIRRTNGSMDVWTRWRKNDTQLNGFIEQKINEAKEPLNNNISSVSSKMDKIYGLSQSPVFIYVSKLGTDSGNGTKTNPYNSIQKAFDSIPKIIDKRYTVMIEPGDYEEEAYLTGVIGGTIFVRSTESPDDVKNINVRVKALNFYDIVGYVHIEDMGTLGGEISRKAFILFSRCIYGSISRCCMDRKVPNKITLYWDGSYGSLGTSFLSNQDLCIQSQNGSTVRVDDTTTSGEGNVIALYSLNGFIFKSGRNSWINNASIPEKKEIGGKIYGSTNNEWNDLEYKNGWSTNSGVPLRYKEKGDDFIFIYGWVNKVPLDTTIIATLPIGSRPINTQRHFVTVTGTADIQTSPPILEIRSNGDIRLVNVGNVPPNNGLAINITIPIL